MYKIKLNKIIIKKIDRERENNIHGYSLVFKYFNTLVAADKMVCVCVFLDAYACVCYEYICANLYLVKIKCKFIW